MSKQKSVCVIGAGLSGLVALKELLAEGHDVVCVERSRDIGGVFSAAGSSYESLMLTVSNYFMAYSDAMPDEPMRFWTGAEYKQYLNNYAARFDLPDKIEFETTVTSLSREGEGWRVTARGPDGESSRVFDHVAICSGLFQRPNIPEIRGLDAFEGEVFHSSRWQDIDKTMFAGKRVLCVGLGESSADITTEISRLAETTILSLRRYHLFSSRFVPTESQTFCSATPETRGMTIDSVQSRAYHSLPSTFKHALVRSFWFGALAANRNDARIKHFVEHNRRGGREPESVITKSESIFEAYAAGRLQENVGGIRTFTTDAVTFNSGETQKIDCVMLCTGYRFALSFLSVEIEDVKDLYKQMIHPDYGASLALIGFVRPQQGGIPLMAEMQARLFARLCSGRHELPPRDALIATAQADKAKYAAEFCATPDVTGLVNGLRFNEDLAALLGCQRSRPSPLNRRDSLRYWHGHIWPIEYRTHGPGALDASEIEAYYRKWGDQQILWPWFLRVQLQVLSAMGSALRAVNEVAPVVSPRLLPRPF